MIRSLPLRSLSAWGVWDVQGFEVWSLKGIGDEASGVYGRLRGLDAKSPAWFYLFPPTTLTPGNLDFRFGVYLRELTGP